MLIRGYKIELQIVKVDEVCHEFWQNEKKSTNKISRKWLF